MSSTVEIARRLRRQQTDAERNLWLKLRNGRLGGLTFRRQMSLNGFVVDFCCPRAKLIVELDGGQHIEQREQDARRTRDLEDSGYFVLRFWNNDVLRNIDGVLEEILNSANQPLDRQRMASKIPTASRLKAPQFLPGFHIQHPRALT